MQQFGAEPTVSVVIPVFNEEQVLPLLAQRLRPTLDALNEPYEVITIDDGSTDASYAVLERMRSSWPQLRVIRFRRNSGQLAALTAGLHRAFGQYVVTLDADLQDPPEVIPRMLELARRDGLDVVYGVRADRANDSFFKRFTADMYYRVLRRLVGTHVPAHVCDYRMLSRTAVDALNQLPERAPIYRLLVPWMGFRSGEVPFVREKRAAGSSKYSARKLFRMAFDIIANFSPAPLRVASWLGALAVFVGAVLGAVAGGQALWADGGASTLLTICAVVVFMGGAQLLCLGIIGEYLGHLHTGAQNRPTYFIASDTGIAGAPIGAMPVGGRSLAELTRQ